MTRFQMLIAAAAVTLFASGSAFAGALQPAAGEAPYMDQTVATQSTLTRSAVEAQAVAALPAAGELSGAAPVAASAVAQTPARDTRDTSGAAAALMPAAGEEPFIS